MMNIDMSLDDLVKQKRTADKDAQKKKKAAAAKKAADKAPKKKGGKDGATAGKPTSASSKKRSAKKKSSGAAMDVEKEMKVAKAVGTSKAKRAAALDAKRGIKKTPKASNADIKAAVKKAQNKVTTSKGTKGGKASIKIKFNAKTLEKDTTKGMMAQIKGVLSKQNRGGAAPGPGAQARPKSAGSNGGRRVVVPSRGRGRR